MKKKQMIEKRVHSLWKSDDQERAQFLKMGVKEWAHSFFYLMSESWAKLKKLMSVEHVAKLTLNQSALNYQILLKQGYIWSSSNLSEDNEVCSYLKVILLPYCDVSFQSKHLFSGQTLLQQTSTNRCLERRLLTR